MKLARCWVAECDPELAVPRLLPEALHALDLDSEKVTEIYGSLEQTVREVREVLELV